MLAAWMVYTVVISVLVGLAALAAERALALLGRPVRWAWVGGVSLALVLAAGPWLVRAGGHVAESPPRGTLGAAPSEAFATATLRIPSTIEIPEQGLLAGLDAPLTWAWAGGVAGLLVWFVAGSWVLRIRRRRWGRIRIGGQDVLVSSDVGPAVLGVLRNRVVVPRWCLSLPERSVELVLAHEEEHRRAGDTRLLVPAVATAALLPWNLPLWWMVRRLREAVELDCDARVLRRFPDRRRTYGELLLMVCSRRASPSGALATFSEHRSTLGRRIRMLTRTTEERSLRRALVLSVVGGLLIVVSCLVPGPDREGVTLLGPDEDPSAAALPPEAAEPHFTPYEVQPEIRNAAAVREALQREYPAVLRDAGIGGVVVAYMYIDRDGTVGNAVIHQTSGHAGLDEAALRVAREFRFTPALNRGETVPVWVSIPIRFELREGEAPTRERVPFRSGVEGGPVDPPAARGAQPLDEEPVFTPYEVEPEVLNGAEVAEAIRREYPPVLRAAGIGGTVGVYIFVEADGEVGNVAVASASGHAALDAAALRVARELRFAPALNRGERVPVWVQIPVRFEGERD